MTAINYLAPSASASFSIKAIALPSKGYLLPETVMTLSKLNDYIQTLATIGAIAGLLLVAYEIRQSTRIALAESYRDGSLAFADMLLSGLESGISGPIATAATHPETLTLEQKVEINFWLRTHVVIIDNEYSQILALGVDVEKELRAYDKVVEKIAQELFSSAWARAWFYEEESRLPPQTASAIRRALEKTPLNRRIDNFKRIDERAATIQ